MQSLTDLLLRLLRQGSHNLQFRLLWRFRNVLARFWDPLVTVDWAGTQIQLPFSHNAPFNRLVFPFYDRALVRIAACIAQEKQSLRIIDVGANIGDSALLLIETLKAELLCVEADPGFFGLLESNTALKPQIERAQACLGAINQQATLVYQKSAGSGSFQNRPNAPALPMRTLVDLLKEWPHFASAHLLKIDTDGFDLEILRGAEPWIAQQQPFLFFEYDPAYFCFHTQDPLEVFNRLHLIGYSRALFYDNQGELLGLVALNERERVSDLYHYILQRGSHLYWDICALPDSAPSLSQSIIRSETAFYRAAKFGGV